MKIYAGITDQGWFDYLRESIPPPEDINFWQPGGNRGFGALSTGGPFLFKLKAPVNAIGGMGFFVSESQLPLTLAWDTFGDRNGCGSYAIFKAKIDKYKRKLGVSEIDSKIGNIVLTQPIFFAEEDWIPVADKWAGVMTGRSYDTEQAEGKRLWARVEDLLTKYRFLQTPVETRSPLEYEEKYNEQNKHS